MWTYNHMDELYHYGVLGMKWGRRRYQNKDGTLTNAGKRRYDSEMDKLKKEEKVLKNKQRTQAKIEKLNSKKREIEELKRSTSGKKEAAPETKSKKKRLRDMSDADLKKLHDRLSMEKNISDLQKKDRTAGEKFVSSLARDVLLPAAVDVGKQLAKSALTGAANKLLKLEGDYKVATNNKKK